MSRLRLKFDGILPCDPALIFEAMEELFPKVVYKSEQEHIDFIKENNIVSSHQWHKYRKDNNLTEKGYVSCPWKFFFKKTRKQFFEDIFGKMKTEQEHIDFMKQNKITGSTQWHKYRKDNNLKEQRYSSCPWNPFNKTIKQFFEEINGKKIYKSEQYHKDIIKDNNITTSEKWYKYWKDNNLIKKGYFSCPWKSFDKSIKQFFEEINGKIKTEKQHVDFIKQNKITGSTQWTKYYKDNNPTKQGYLSCPWTFFNKTIKQFFEEINGKKIYKSEQEHIDFMKQNDITVNRKWYKYWKDNNLKEQGYLSCPWSKSNKTIKQFFEEIRK